MRLRPSTATSSTGIKSSSARVWQTSPARFSAYPASGSFNRSGVNLVSGARTPFAAICATLFLIVILFFVAPLARYLPFAVIAGLLFLVAWGLIDFREIRRIWHEEPRERWPLLATFIATITLSLEWAHPDRNHRGVIGATVSA